jgi:hypothetical protein
MTECEDLELKGRTAPEGSEKRGQKSGQYLPKRETMEERQLPVYQSDRISENHNGRGGVRTVPSS